MSKLSRIRIRNFKGVDDVTIEVEGGKSPGRFVTLVGLNESGKTSIIEAISLSVLQDPDTADLLQATNIATDMSEVVPKHHSAGFTGAFQISTEIDFTSNTALKKRIEAIIKKDGFTLMSPIPQTINITKSYVFQESNYTTNNLTWSFAPNVKKGQSQKIEGLFEKGRATWLKCLKEMKDCLPQSIYFPTFLVNFPKRVYLEGDYGKIDAYYRRVISDVLNGLSNPLGIEKHIIDRVNLHRSPGSTFSSALRSSKEGRQIDATVQALAAELNFVVFGAWGEIFNKPITNRKIAAEWHIDEQQDNHIYVEFYIIAGDHRFYLAERSLGFRWFFSFLLFTQFQGSRTANRKLLFLFDEPASHLHPKAQERLLKSFTKIAEPNHLIIYSTHSHYMINPLWLEQAYIVSNSAIDAENDDTGMSYVDARVHVKAQKYKSFVENNPSKTTYYQPVLDVLDYSSGGLDLADPVVILEGKFDYYPMRYAVEELGRSKDFRIIPAVGAGGLSALVGILRAWGVRFLILLDDDDAGRKEKGKYKNHLMLSNDQVVTLDELDSSLKDSEFECIFQKDVRVACVNAGFGSSGNISKSQFYTYFQSLQAKLIPASPMPETLGLFEKLLNEIASRLANQ